MANLHRSAKSSIQWNAYDLTAFNIQVIPTDIQTFFGTTILPKLTSVSPAIISNESASSDPDPPLSKSDAQFFSYMKYAMHLHPLHGSDFAAGEFAMLLLKLMNYDSGDRLIHSRHHMHFEMCGKSVGAVSDASVTASEGIGCLLPSMEYDLKLMRSSNTSEPTPYDKLEPRLIACAIAAFSSLNLNRASLGIPALQSKTIPGFTMVGTTPTFYKTPVTQALMDCLADGKYPETPTVVEKLVLPVADVDTLVRDGMRDLGNRVVVLECFEALKQFL